MRFIIFGFACLVLGCNSNQQNTDAGAESQTNHNNPTDTIVTTEKPVQLSGCYEMLMKRDTATLKIDLADSTVTGQLDYHFFEKDSNSGTIKGVVRNGYIYAEYHFMSEGTTSVREVVFKIVDDTLIQGFGDLKEQNGRLIFTDKNTLQYQHATPFLKVPCAAG
jgi:hypothetical protein